MLRRLKITFVVAFCLMLSAPGIQKRFQLFHYEALDENRFRAPCPTDWWGLFTEGTPFARKYEEYFNDSFGFRDLLVRIKHQLDYSLFRESDRVLVGRDGWLFYRSIVEQEEIYIEEAPRSAFDDMFRRFDALRDALAKRGITLIVVPCPMNNTVYPEMLPDDAPSRKHPSGLNRYVEHFRNRSGFVLVDPMPILLEVKQRFPAYHKTDFHWTDPAGAHVAKALVDELGELSGIGPLWDQPIEVEWRTDAVGGEATAMGLLRPVEESRVQLRAQAIIQANGLIRDFGPNDWAYESAEPEDARLLPPTVLFGDSFADAFRRSGFHRYFRRLRKFPNLEFRNRYADIPEGTRFVVLQHIEVFLNQILDSGKWPPFLDVPSSAHDSSTGPRPEAAKPQRRTSATGTLTAGPNPVPICPETGLGTTEISWQSVGTNAIEVRVGAPDGLRFASGEGSGRATTGRWVSRGTTFFLQDASMPVPHARESTVASLRVDVVEGSCQ